MPAKNEHYEMTIDDIGHAGEGIGRVNGFTLFVEGALPGDVVEARIVKLKKNYGYGKLIRVIQPSADRTRPVCPVFGQCGGCGLQHMSYSAQLAYKRKKTADDLARIGGVRDVAVPPVLGMDNPLHYRNKAQFPVRAVNGEAACGLFKRRSHTLVPVKKCFIQHPVTERILAAVERFMHENGVPPYDETTHTGVVRHVLTRVAFATGEIMACVVINSDSPGQFGALVQALEHIPGMASICVNINRKKTNVILGERTETLWGKPVITDWIGGLRFEISTASFFQVNPVQTRVLYDTAVGMAGIRPGDVVIDAFCGIGTLSLFMAQRAKMVYGVEIVEQAVRDARRNALLNGVANAEFIAGDALEAMRRLHGLGAGADILVVDPPRAGCDAALLQTALAMAPGKILYVSCDTATLARDIRALTQGGYRVSALQPVDCFPMTTHVETVVLLSKLKSTTSIEVKIDLDEMDLTKSESKATYEEIKQYILDKFGFKVSQLYVAQVKRKHGIIERDNYNVGDGKSKVPQVPADKEKAVEDALKHFQMI